MTKETTRLINNYKWNDKELNILTTKGAEYIVDKVRATDEQTFAKAIAYFDGWLMGENTKAKANYWAKKCNMTTEELNIWCTM